MRITINGSPSLLAGSLDDVRAHAAGAHVDGFGGYWLAQTGLVDALTAFCAIAPDTGTMELGTAVIPTFPRHPTMLAGQALSTQAVVGGRLALGIGLSHKPAVEDRLGMAFERPVRHLMDYLEILQSLLETGGADHTGEVFSAHMEAGGRPTDTPPAVLVAALGEQTLRVTGRRTDGTVLWLVGPKTIGSHVSPRIREAAAEVGRPDPRVVCSLPITVADDEAEVRELHSMLLAGYDELPSYRAMLDREGADKVGDVSVVGNEDSVREQLASIAAAGATEFAAAEIGRNPDESARTRELLKSL
ncbi:MAG: TIGR03564 family F420-dependent LLM class oxidoreductase [Acidimicrobiia bacterium]|nr:TIGR03564 family F420-dependent LLM class oxidoreductase [Acidimicrobiia bacterium]